MGLLNNCTLIRACNYTRLQFEHNVKRFNVVFYRQKSTKDNPEIPRNVVEGVYTASQQAKKGVIYDKKPFKMRCVPNKKYHWCACGQSKNQPLCDGSHKNPYVKVELRPVRFEVAEDKEYYLCNCKQTSNRPFCDGTHKKEEIQNKIK